jgi:hypothetical protein
MPAAVWTDWTALLYFAEVSICLAVAQALVTGSHGGLRRMFKGSWSGHTLLDLALRTLFTVVGR